MKKSLKIFLIFAAALLVICCGVVVSIFLPKKISPEHVFISEVIVRDQDITVKGSLGDSALGYSGYKAGSEGGAIYLGISGRLSSGNLDGSFTITLDQNQYGKPNAIYLRKGSNTLKIWPK